MRRVSMARQGWGTNAQNESATTFFLVRAVASPSLSPAPVCLFGEVNKRGAGSGPWEDHRSADEYAGWVVRGGGWGGGAGWWRPDLVTYLSLLLMRCNVFRYR